MEIEDLGRRFATGEVSIDQAADELMKLRKVPTENFGQKKTELKKLLQKVKQGIVSKEQFLDETMRMTCDMSDKEDEIREQEGCEFFPFTGLDKDATFKWMKKVIEGGFVPWDIKVEILLQIGIRTLLNLKEKPKQQKNAFSLIVNCLAVTLPEAAADEVLAQSIEGHKELRQDTELTLCGNITVKDILAGEIL